MLWCYRRTGNVIEINARKDSHGFELIEDYFPDSSMYIITVEQISYDCEKFLAMCVPRRDRDVI